MTRPLIGCLVFFATLQPHLTRSKRKKAEFQEDASRITWVGALVSLGLAVFAFAGVYGRSA